jgi:hypothetical protein
MSIGPLPSSWKLFRIACIVQMVLVALQLVLGVSGIFYRKQIIFPLTEALAYGIVFIFVYTGLSLLNYNYPDSPLTTSQRRNFNWLFLINFLLIAYLFGQLLTAARWIIPFLPFIKGGFLRYLSVVSWLLIDLAIFVLHIIFLLGMYQLRRVIYQNTMNSWYNQFDEEKK